MRRTKEEAEKTRQDILRSAAYLFADKGVAKTSLNDIAVKANVTRGAIYWHFKNKTEIFDALFESLHQPFVAMIWDELDKNQEYPLKQLEEICVRIFVNLKTDPDKVTMLRLFFRKCNYSGDLAIYREKHNQMKAEKYEAFAKFFERAQAKGDMPKDTDPQLLTLSMNAYIKGILFEYLDSDDSQILDQVPALMRLYFQNWS